MKEALRAWDGAMAVDRFLSSLEDAPADGLEAACFQAAVCGEVSGIRELGGVLPAERGVGCTDAVVLQTDPRPFAQEIDR